MGDHYSLNKFYSKGHDYRLVADSIIEATKLPARPYGRTARHGRVYSVPRHTCASFTERGDVLAELESKLNHAHQSSAVPHAVAVHGLGGTGKTQIALHFAITRRGAYSAVLWFDASDPKSLLASFHRVSYHLGLDSSYTSIANYTLESSPVVSQVLLWLSDRPSEANWLAVFDGVDDHSWGLRRYIPTGSAGSIIITSQDRQAPALIDGACEALSVGMLSEGEAVQLILVRVSKLLSDTARPHATKLASEISGLLGRLPIALGLAEAHINNDAEADGPIQALQRYADGLRSDYKNELLLNEELTGLSGTDMAMRTVWNRTLRKVAADFPKTRPDLWLSLVSLSTSDRFHDNLVRWAMFVLRTNPVRPIQLFKGGLPDLTAPFPPWLLAILTPNTGESVSEWDSTAFRDVKRVLVRFHLVESFTEESLPESSSGGITLHPIVKWYAARAAEKHNLLTHFCGLCSLAFYGAHRSNVFQAFAVKGQYELQGCVRGEYLVFYGTIATHQALVSAQAFPEILDILATLDVCLNVHAETIEAPMGSGRRVDGISDALELTAEGLTSLDNGRLMAAHSTIEELLTRKVSGSAREDDKEMVYSTTDLALDLLLLGDSIQWQLDDPSIFIPPLKRLFELRKQSRGNNDPITLDTMNALSNLYRRAGRFGDAAETITSQLVEHLEGHRSHGEIRRAFPSSWRLCDSIHTQLQLLEIYIDQSSDCAIAGAKEITRWLHQEFGEKHVSVQLLRAQSVLSLAAFASGDVKTAEKSFRDVVDAREELKIMAKHAIFYLPNIEQLPGLMMTLVSMLSENLHRSTLRNRHRYPWRVAREAWPGGLALQQLRTVDTLVTGLMRQGRKQEAFEFLDSSERKFASLIGVDNPYTVMRRIQEASILQSLGHGQQARSNLVGWLRQLFSEMAIATDDENKGFQLPESQLALQARGVLAYAAALARNLREVQSEIALGSPEMESETAIIVEAIKHWNIRPCEEGCAFLIAQLVENLPSLGLVEETIQLSLWLADLLPNATRIAQKEHLYLLLRPLDQLGLSLMVRGAFCAEAIMLLERLATYYESHFGECGTNAALARLYLGTLLHRVGKYEQSVTALHQAFNCLIRQSPFNVRNFGILQYFFRLADSLLKLDRIDEAFAVAKEWMEIRAEQMALLLQCSPRMLEVHYSTLLDIVHSSQFPPSGRADKTNDHTRLLIIASVLEELLMHSFPKGFLQLRAIAMLANHLEHIALAPEDAVVVLAAHINICDHFCIGRDAYTALTLVAALMDLGEHPDMIRAIHVALPGYYAADSAGLLPHIQWYRSQFEEYVRRYPQFAKSAHAEHHARLRGVPPWLAAELRRFAAVTAKGRCSRVEDFYISVEDGRIALTT